MDSNTLNHWLEVYVKDGDITSDLHTKFASKLTGIPIPDITREVRTKAKEICYEIIYKSKFLVNLSETHKE